VLVNVAFRQSFLCYKNGNGAYIGFIAFYAACFVVTWFVYLRKRKNRLNATVPAAIQPAGDEFFWSTCAGLAAVVAAAVGAPPAADVSVNVRVPDTVVDIDS